MEQSYGTLVRVRAPDSWTEFANHHLISEVWLVDDDSLPRSARSGDKVFVNTRGTYWRNYSLPPISAKSYEEVVVLRFLKEVAHVWLRHESPGGAPSVQRFEDVTLLEMDAERREATLWAVAVRDRQPQLFARLLEDFKRWLATHTAQRAKGTT